MSEQQQHQAKLGLTKYRKGSYVLMEGNEGKDVFFIIKSGQVQVQRSVDRLVQHLEGPEILKPGDFFGVISAMSGHPSTETAIPLTDVDLITVPRDEFGYLIKQSSQLAMKIIKYFSKKLRFSDSVLTQLSLKKKEEESDFSKTFEIADYYFNSGMLPLAIYAYQRYLDLIPIGEKRKEAEDKLTSYKRFKDDAFNNQNVPNSMNKKFKKDTFIFCEHEPGNELFIIQQGKVKITKLLGSNEVLLAVLKNGDIFGEMALLEDQPRSASAIAYDQDTSTLAVNRQNFASMVIEQPQLATRLITILSERLWSIYRQINNILLEDPAVRAYDTLLTIILKERIPIKRHEKYMFDFGVKELLNMLGLTNKGKDDVIQALNDKLFRIETNRIICNDIEELQKRVAAYIKKLEILRKSKIK